MFNQLFVSVFVIVLPILTKAWISGYHTWHTGRENSKFFTDDWTVEVEGGEEVAQLVALDLGYEYGGPGYSQMKGTIEGMNIKKANKCESDVYKVNSNNIHYYVLWKWGCRDNPEIYINVIPTNT